MEELRLKINCGLLQKTWASEPVLDQDHSDSWTSTHEDHSNVAWGPFWQLS